MIKQCVYGYVGGSGTTGRASCRTGEDEAEYSGPAVWVLWRSYASRKFYGRNQNDSENDEEVNNV
jgi:hypothetical protein